MTPFEAGYLRTVKVAFDMPLSTQAERNIEARDAAVSSAPDIAVGGSILGGLGYLFGGRAGGVLGTGLGAAVGAAPLMDISPEVAAGAAAGGLGGTYAGEALGNVITNKTMARYPIASILGGLAASLGGGALGAGAGAMLGSGVDGRQGLQWEGFDTDEED